MELFNTGKDLCFKNISEIFVPKPFGNFLMKWLEFMDLSYLSYLSNSLQGQEGFKLSVTPAVLCLIFENRIVVSSYRRGRSVGLGSSFGRHALSG